MSRTETKPELLFCLMKVSKAITQWAKSNISARNGMTVPRATVLIGLALTDTPKSMSEHGEYLGLSPRSMTVLVDGLEKEGLVRRVPHERDRRITNIEITDDGRELANEVLGPSQLASAALFDDLTVKERDDLLRLLNKVADSLRSRGIDVPRYTASTPPGQG